MVDLRRLFHIPDRNGYLADLQGLIARAGLGPLGADEVKALGAAHRMSREASTQVATAVASDVAKGLSLADFKAGKADQLRAFAESLGVAPATVDGAVRARAEAVASDVAKALSLADFKAGKADQLRAFAESLGVAPARVDGAVRARAEAAFSEWAAPVVRSGQVSDADFADMREVGRALGIDEAAQNRLYGVAIHPAVMALVDAAIAHDSLSPEQDASLSLAISERYKIKPDFADVISEHLDHARTGWAVAIGPLPVVAVPLSLQRGEVAHAVVSAIAYQTASRTKSIGYAGPALRIRIAKGLYYRVGAYQVYRQTEQYEKALGRGSLVVTNTRLLFMTADRTSSARLDSILHIEPFSDALNVVRSSGKPTTYRFDKVDEWFGAILARAIHDATA